MASHAMRPSPHHLARQHGLRALLLALALCCIVPAQAGEQACGMLSSLLLVVARAQLLRMLLPAAHTPPQLQARRLHAASTPHAAVR